MEFAQFNPILEPNREQMLDYYSQYNISVPDNILFRNYFDIKEEDIPQISQSTRKYNLPVYSEDSDKKVGI